MEDAAQSNGSHFVEVRVGVGAVWFEHVCFQGHHRGEVVPESQRNRLLALCLITARKRLTTSQHCATAGSFSATYVSQLTRLTSAMSRHCRLHDPGRANVAFDFESRQALGDGHLPHQFTQREELFLVRNQVSVILQPPCNSAQINILLT